MTFLELQTYVSDLLDDTANDYFSLTQIKLWINLAAQQLQLELIDAGEGRYKSCLSTSTVANQKRYKLPTDFIAIHNLELVLSGSGDTADVQPLFEVSQGESHLVQSTSRVTGKPANYWMDKEHLVLAPVPDKAYELRMTCARRIDTMTLDADVPDIPLEYHELIGLMAVEIVTGKH